jgi:hypothetical protein
MKKGLAGLAMQLGLCVPMACSHVSKALRLSKYGLQDVWAGDTIKACKMCRQMATVQHMPC